MALMVASVPELTKRTSSIDGMISQTRLASSVSIAVGAPKDRPSSAAAAHRLDDLRMGVAEDHRAPGADVVDVAAAVLAPDVGARRLADEHRIAADGAECAHGRVDAAGDVALGFLEQVHDWRASGMAGPGAGPAKKPSF
jgi:hypothetical protein